MAEISIFQTSANSFLLYVGQLWKTCLNSKQNRASLNLRMAVLRFESYAVYQKMTSAILGNKCILRSKDAHPYNEGCKQKMSSLIHFLLIISKCPHRKIVILHSMHVQVCIFKFYVTLVLAIAYFYTKKHQICEQFRESKFL